MAFKRWTVRVRLSPPAKTAFSGGFFAGGDEARSQPGKTKVLAVRTREASFAPQAQAPFISAMQQGMKQEIEQAGCQSRLYTLAKRVLPPAGARHFVPE